MKAYSGSLMDWTGEIERSQMREPVEFCGSKDKESLHTDYSIWVQVHTTERMELREATFRQAQGVVAACVEKAGNSVVVHREYKCSYGGEGIDVERTSEGFDKVVVHGIELQAFQREEDCSEGRARLGQRAKKLVFQSFLCPVLRAHARRGMQGHALVKSPVCSVRRAARQEYSLRPEIRKMMGDGDRNKGQEECMQHIDLQMMFSAEDGWYDSEVYMLISNRSKAGVDSGVDSEARVVHRNLQMELEYRGGERNGVTETEVLTRNPKVAAEFNSAFKRQYRDGVQTMELN
ncbi:hypothetical protein B0H13DRAFT_1911813 [Mycena leptocephala]|nr:hypothetical protein B0H13DRAFT_1911813 [Mycena leptocephala]